MCLRVAAIRRPRKGLERPCDGQQQLQRQANHAPPGARGLGAPTSVALPRYIYVPVLQDDHELPQLRSYAVRVDSGVLSFGAKRKC